MYLITWQDARTGESKKLKVHTMRAVQDVTRTLDRSASNRNVNVTYIAPRRLREIVISIE